MRVKHVKGYISLILIVVVISTAWTATTWFWRGRTLKLLALQGSDYLLAAAKGQEIFSIVVTPERSLGSLEFRFRSLAERDPKAVGIDIKKVGSVEDLMDIWPPVTDRLDYFSAVGVEPFVSIHEVPVTNMEDHRVIIVDFGKVYSALFDPRHENESLTTFAFLINSTDHIVRYFEGYSDFLAVRQARGSILRKEGILDLVRVESGGEIQEFVPEPVGKQLSIKDGLPAWGQITFHDTAKDKPFSVTMVAKEGNLVAGTLLIAVETYAEGQWFKQGSGYWIVKTSLR